jgi:leucyl-tRNA synthetase
MQQNWIGKSRGARVQFAVANVASPPLEVFTTRVDTIYGVSAVLLSPAHPNLPDLLSGVPGGHAMEQQLKTLQQGSVKTEEIATAEKVGFFTGRFALNPFSGERVPIWVANFVLAEYGTGAVMAVPAHDQRDFEFAEKYNLPVKVVVEPPHAAPLHADRMTEAYTDYGRLVDSGPYTGLTSEQAIEKMAVDAEAQGFGKPETPTA